MRSLKSQKITEIMNDKSDKEFDEKIPERPLECGECKKPIEVRYTEIVGDQIVNTSMCADCPQLIKRLFGLTPAERAIMHGEAGSVACGECGTTLEALKFGNPLGCYNCYEVFGDIIIAELLETEKVPVRIGNIKKTTPIHIGRSPGEVQEMNPSLRILALNEALTETLKREDYEQAAWLRDQIKALTENQQTEGEPSDESKG